MRPCAWCRRELSATAAHNARFCCRRCRQAAFRLRLASPGAVVEALPLRFVYADPPYPGLSRKYHGRHPDFAGEVDHGALLSRIEDELEDLFPGTGGVAAAWSELSSGPVGSRVDERREVSACE
jgi:hypothetical protein